MQPWESAVAVGNVVNAVLGGIYLVKKIAIVRCMWSLFVLIISARLISLVCIANQVTLLLPVLFIC